VISERTVKLYEQHPPEARQGQQAPTLPELLHEVEVAAKFGTSRDELAHQLGYTQSCSSHWSRTQTSAWLEWWLVLF